MNEELLKCCECDIEGTWDGGSSNGSLYECESCNEIICLKCLSKDTPFTAQTPEVLCNTCKVHKQ